jgi:hypothetical protein
MAILNRRPLAGTPKVPDNVRPFVYGLAVQCSRSVVSIASVNGYQIAFYLIPNAVFVSNPAAPEMLQAVLQWLWLANAFKRILPNGFY